MNDYPTLTERHPSVRIALLAFAAGITLAIAIAGAIALSMWAGGAPWVVALETGAQLTVLLMAVCPCTLATCALLVYQRRVVEAVSPVALSQSMPEIVSPEIVSDTLAEQVVLAAQTQLEWKYRYQDEPTRAMCAGRGISQPLWNSGRRIVTEMGLVSGKTWVSENWEQIHSMLDRIVADGDKVWFPLWGQRGLHTLRVVSQGDNNSYLVEGEE